jgi:adenylate kinase family enzyme
MRRILVLGPPGSGKSTLARRLGATLGLPVFHLDQAYHQPGWTPVAPKAFRAEVERIAALPAWVIDGNYTDTVAPRLGAADTLIYLDLPAWVSLLRVLRRIVTSYGRVRPDSAAGCPERLDMAFLRFVWSWNRRRRSRNLALVAGFAGAKIVLRGRRVQRRLRDGKLTGDAMHALLAAGGGHRP